MPTPQISVDELVELFVRTATAVRQVLDPVTGSERRARTKRPGQYAIDLIADAAALQVLADAPVSVLSEESGVTEVAGSEVTVVIDPVDGSTNAARGLSYWATSICAVDAEGPLVALVTNQATGTCSTAVRGGGAWRDGVSIHTPPVEHVEESVICLSGAPATALPWRQFRAMGSAALSLCDVAAGVVEGYVDAVGTHGPWDYLGGLLICNEAGAVVTEAQGRELVTLDYEARLQIMAASTPALMEELMKALRT